MIQRTALLAAAILTTGVALPAMAQTSPAPPEQPTATGVITPDWEQRPQLEFPQGAMKDGIWAGDVVVRCRVGADRRLHDCETMAERPAGAGFGEAAVTGLESGVITEAWLRAHQTSETGRLVVKFRMAE